VCPLCVREGVYKRMAQVRESPRELHDLATGRKFHNIAAAQLTGVLGACEQACVWVSVGMRECVRVCARARCVCVCVCVCVRRASVRVRVLVCELKRAAGRTFHRLMPPSSPNLFPGYCALLDDGTWPRALTRG
jgi:hypothetical protein